MNRSVPSFVSVVLVLLGAFALWGCGGEDSPAESEEQGNSASGEGSYPEFEPKGVGEAAEVGPLSITLNDAKPYSSKEQGEGAASQTHYYAVADLSLETRDQDPFDASDVDYLLRDEEGYSFERESIPDQKPPPEGQITPGGKTSGQVAFDLGTEPVGTPLTLFVSLPEVEGGSQGVFEFEVRHEAQKNPQPGQEAQEGEEEASGPSPGYNLIETPDGGLSAEVPQSWGVETGEDSEKEAGPNTWSNHAGEYLLSSITTAPSLEVWYGGEEGSSGAYFAASRTLAQYSDYELTHSFSHASKDEVCAEVGPYDDYERPPLSGKLQTWYGCGADGGTVYTLAASPEGRECVVTLQARIHEEADREAIEHLVDTVEVDCGRVTSGPLPASSNSAPPEESASPEATPAPEATPSSPESSATPAPDSPEPEAGTKHVEVVVSSDVPVDVSITDDNFDVSIAEEITGTQTYEFDIAADSGLLVSAMNADLRGNVSIEVYENGQLKTQDTDSSGYAQVMY